MLNARESPISLNERAFLLSSLSSGLRLDGRTPLDARAVAIQFGQKSGTVEVAMGQSRVLASVSAELQEPFADRPSEGRIAFHVDFSPIASPFFEPANALVGPSDRAMEISRSLEKAIRESRAIDLESLCVIGGRRVWSLRVDLHLLDYNGNFMDCAHLAAIVALSHFRRPDVTVVGDRVIIHSIDDRQPVLLCVHHKPLAVTFAFYGEQGEQFIIDPALKEELTAKATLTLSMNVHKELCYAQKTGGLAIPSDLIIKCTAIAARRAEELTQIINDRIKEDADQPHNRVYLSMPKSRKEEPKPAAATAPAPLVGAAMVPVTQVKQIVVPQGDEEDDDEEDEEMAVEEIKKQMKKKRSKADLSDSDSEDDVDDSEDDDEAENARVREFQAVAARFISDSKQEKGKGNGKQQQQPQAQMQKGGNAKNNNKTRK